jgi:hypothetical protein
LRQQRYSPEQTATSCFGRTTAHHSGVIDPFASHRDVARPALVLFCWNRRRTGRKHSQVQALNHSSLKFNSFALRRPFCGRMK